MRVHEVLSPVDNLGRAHFVATWETNNVGPHCDQHGTRYQHFFANLAEFRQEHEA